MASSIQVSRALLNLGFRLSLVMAFAVAPAIAQDSPLDPNSAVKFDLRRDAPISLESFDPAGSRSSSRGGALVLDLHIALQLRNNSGDTIRSVTLLLLAQDSTPGGKMSVAKTGLNVGPGQKFPVRIDGRVLRPMQPAGGPLVHVSIDGVLFKNYEFYGPDRLNSHRQMLAWEMQAERDRGYFKKVLQTRGEAGLQQEMLNSQDRQAARPRLDVQVARGRTTSSAASAPADKPAQFTFLQLPDSPVKPIDGSAEIAGNEARSPQIHVQNTSSKNIRYLEIAWLVKDLEGKEYMAGSLPAADGTLYLPPGRTAHLLQETSLRFSRNNGRPVDIQHMTGFVSQVEFTDGNIWIPKRESLRGSDLLRVMPPSPEEQRLSDFYRTKGLAALVRELNSF